MMITITINIYFIIIIIFILVTGLTFLLFVARHIMTQVVKGVLYLHSHGIIHRDLTLGNILLTKEMDAVSLFL